MKSYLQRIADRSVGMEMVGNDPVSFVLPGNQPVAEEMQTDFIEETVIKSGSAKNPDAVGSPFSPNLKATESYSAANEKNKLEPNRTNEKPEVIINNQDQEKPVVGEEIRGIGKQNPQPFSEIHSIYPQVNPTQSFVSFSEKISERNRSASTEIANEKSEISTGLNEIKESDSSDLNTVIPVFKSNQESAFVTENHGKGMERNADFLEKKSGSERLIPDAKVELKPADQSPVPSNAPQKDQSAPKLIIGRITVEVIPPAPVKAKETPRRQTAVAKPAGNERSGINKLSFGLGQL